MFSRRIPGDLRPNALARLRDDRTRIPFDLTLSNPTLCGIPYPDGLLAPLGRAAGLAYLPDPLGSRGAREAVAEEYGRMGEAADPAAMVLTASTSEAYAFLFKTLCDPGDAVLVPAPSYPLFEHLAALEGVRAIPYPLDPTGGFQPDVHAAAGSGARALVAVHPNNPTGTYVGKAAAEELRSICAPSGMALIVDEVFHAYPLGAGENPAEVRGSFAGESETLTFRLNGLSKHVGLPQLKLAWILVSGPPELRDAALERLAFVADNYLSVGTPVQLSLRPILREGASVRKAILDRCSRNLAFLESSARSVPGVTVPRPAGGWSAVLRYPRVTEEERIALDLLEQDGVAVHPGYFFDFPEEGWLALSLLPPPAAFEEGVRLLLRRVEDAGV
jgi:hypothetical protein